MDEASRISDAFLDVRHLKLARRQSVLDKFNQKSAAFDKGRFAKDEIKGLKCELLDTYCEQLLGEVEVFSLKAMIARTIEMLSRLAIKLPKPKLLFTQNIDPQASSISQLRPLEESDDQGRDMSIFSADLSLVNLWRLPHPLEIVEELPKESRTLTAYLEMLWALHNMAQVLTAYSNAIPKPLIMTKDRLVGMDFVQAEMSKVCNAVEGLKDTATHCNTLQHTATHCNTLQRIATHCNTLQHTATHCNTLCVFVSFFHCNTLQHTVCVSLFLLPSLFLSLTHTQSLSLPISLSTLFINKLRNAV